MNARGISLLFLALALPAPGWGESEDDVSAAAEQPSETRPKGPSPRLTTEEFEREIGHVQDAEGNWVDASHQYIGNRADDLAIYLDRFFGSPLDDLESADSTVRFIARLDWDQEDGLDQKFRLRGKVDLPRISDRLSLVFNGEEGSGRAALDEFEAENTAGLQLNAADGRHSRFDFTLGLSSGPNLKPGVRYRFKDTLHEDGRFRYTWRADYSDSKRFRHINHVELDHLTGETSLLRWSTRLERGQVSEGTEWTSGLSWVLGYSLDSAFAASVFMAGKTNPDVPDAILEGRPYEGMTYPLPLSPDDEGGSLVTNYGFKLRFRNRLYKDWLYIEFEPGYTWRQRNHFQDRDGVAFARINLEVTFNRGREDYAGRKGDKSPAPSSNESTPADTATALDRASAEDQ